MSSAERARASTSGARPPAASSRAMNRLLVPTIALAGGACAPNAAAKPVPAPLAAAESSYQAVRALKDATDIARELHSRTVPSGDSLAAVARAYGPARDGLDALLRAADSAALDTVDQRALGVMRLTARAELAADSATGPPADTARPDCAYSARAIAALAHGLDSLAARMDACYSYEAMHVMVDGQRLDRLGVLGRMTSEPSAAERRRLFLTLVPLFQSVNGADDENSPYRQMVRLSAARWREQGSPVSEAARAAGIAPDSAAVWLERILARWRDVTPDSLVEPWDYDYLAGAAERRLDKRISHAGLPVLNAAYYRALGADVDTLHVHYDLAPRAGKTAVAYTTFGRRARLERGAWVRGDEWVFATYEYGGLDNLAELMHETGHAIHIAAIRTRPAFFDWPDDDAFTEGIADIAALETTEPAWQQRWLGDSASLAEDMRSRYAAIMMDVCWSLFEIRMHANPEADPNVVWSDLTSTYLHIRPHPELSWWARREQLISLPGYMSNYAIGGIIIADLRARLIAEHGNFALGDSTWYTWTSARLYQWGLERTSRSVIEGFLGRPLSPDALLADLARMRPIR